MIQSGWECGKNYMTFTLQMYALSYIFRTCWLDRQTHSSPEFPAYTQLTLLSQSPPRHLVPPFPTLIFNASLAKRSSASDSKLSIDNTHNSPPRPASQLLPFAMPKNLQNYFTRLIIQLPNQSCVEMSLAAFDSYHSCGISEESHEEFIN